MKEFRNTIFQLQADIEFCRDALIRLIRDNNSPKERAELQQRVCNCIGQAGALVEYLASAAANEGDNERPAS